jgi:hypothetical protein
LAAPPKRLTVAVPLSDCAVMRDPRALMLRLNGKKLRKWF